MNAGGFRKAARFPTFLGIQSVAPLFCYQEASRVMACLLHPTRLRRVLGFTPILFGIFLVSGCDPDGYSDDIRYGVRTDTFLDAAAKLPDQDVSIDRPGELDDIINRVAKLGAATFDPKKLNVDQRKELTKSLE